MPTISLVDGIGLIRCTIVFYRAEGQCSAKKCRDWHLQHPKLRRGRLAMEKIKSTYRYLFDSSHGSTSHFLARWLFLRALGLIYFSAFFALLFQVRGLIGSQGILPAADYLQNLRGLEVLRSWY